MELLNGQTLGDYVVLKELGHGGVGHVYEVEHTITRRREAVKVVSFEGAGETEGSERFLREIRLQAALNHPNIAAVHNAFWTDDNFILVSELLEGEPLQALISRGPLGVDGSIEIIRQVLAALRCAHSRGIMHRDISPANIFVTMAGPVKLIDFGLAKAATDLNVTQAGLAVGSFYYTSPEQIRAEPTVDIRTDLYSCGAVLYEMLTGRKPFEGTAFEVMQAHCERSAERPNSIDGTIPGAVSDVVMRALAKKPNERFGSAEEFLRGLEQIPVPVSEPVTRARVAPWVLVASGVLTAAIAFAIVRTAPRAIATTPAAPSASIPAAVTPAPAVAPAEVSTPPVIAEPVLPANAAQARPAAKPSVTKQPIAKRMEAAKIAATEEQKNLVEVPAPQAEPQPEVVTDAPSQAITEPQPEPALEAPTHGVMGAVKKLNPFHKRKNNPQ